MTQHPVEGTLQAYLDGEILSEPREVLDRHLDGCRECQATLAELDSLATATGFAVSQLDFAEPPTEAARWELRRARAARRSHVHRRRVAAAAVVVLLCGAGWAAAMPGSPIRTWWLNRPAAEPTGMTEEEVGEQLGPGRTGVSVLPLDGRVSVSFVGVPEESWVEIRLSEIEETAVSAPAGARFATGSGRVDVEIEGLEGDLVVEIPSTAILADVLVDGQAVFRKSGTEVSYPGPAPVNTDSGSVRLRPGGGP